MAKAYLHLILAVEKVGTPIKNASIEDRPIPSPGVTIPGPGERRLMPLVTEGETFEKAREQMLRMIRGEEYCEVGDLRFLEPFLNGTVNSETQETYQQTVHHAILQLPSNSHSPHMPPAWARR